MKSVPGWLSVCAVLVLGLAPRVFAQSDPNGPDPEKVKVHVGPVMMNPTVTFGNIGVDDNVFNDSTNPKSDFTMTISPKTDVWLPFLGTWFNGTMTEDVVWYQKYSSERSGNTTYGLNWKLPLTRFTAIFGASRASTRERLGYEIDERAPRTLNNYFADVSVNVLASTALDVRITSAETTYDPSATFQLINLADQLNVTSTAVDINLKRKLTPLTTLTVGLNRSQDRFPMNPLRDADRTDATAALRFDPVALLKGDVSVAYTSYSPHSDTIPGYKGLTMSAGLTYTLYDVTQFVLRADRSLQNSYDITQPYYLQTGFNLQVSQQIQTHIDVVGRGGLEHLNYRDLTDPAVLAASAGAPVVPNRTDTVTTYGVGIGYHLGSATRLGLNYDRTRRSSPIELRGYERANIGASITYDF
jgi:Putative beta-barrel porin 2